MSQQLFYLAMGGLEAVMDRSAASANNLANRNTVGFKAQRPIFAALPVYNQGLPDRVEVAARQDGADLRGGPIEPTGRKLDVAVSGPGWIAVQAPDGSVALTRNGSLSISPLGVLQTSSGMPVLGNGATPISLPPLQSVTIGDDGTISGALQGQSPDQIAALNRIMLSNPPPASLRRRSDGLFASTDGAPDADAGVHLQVGALEGSNADPVSLMLNMIDDTRVFQMQTQLLRASFNLGQGQSSPLTLS
jgi:flagellar basal-body rod protein FlgF